MSDEDDKSVIDDESIEELTRVYQGNLSPTRVSTLLAMAEIGRPRHMVDTVHGIRKKDGKIQACMQARELAIKGLDFDVVVPETNKGKRKSAKAAAELKEALQASENFHNMIAHHTGEGLLFGRSWAETIWSVTEARMWPARWKLINNRRFLFRRKDAKLLFDPAGHGNESDGVDLSKLHGNDKFLQYYPRVNGDDLIREGLYELVLWIGMFRNWNVKDQMSLAEAAWKPRRHVTFAKGETADADRITAERVARLFGRTGRAVSSDSIKIEEFWAKGAATSGHEGLLGWLGREFAMSTLGSTDIVEPGENGARSAVETRNELRIDIKESDAIGQSKMLTRMLSEPFTRLNYGEGVPAPLIIAITEDSEDQESFSKAMVNYRKAGLPVPVSYAYDKAGITPPKEGEELLGDREPKADTDTDAANDPDDESDDADSDEKDDE